MEKGTLKGSKDYWNSTNSHKGFSKKSWKTSFLLDM